MMERDLTKKTGDAMPDRGKIIVESKEVKGGLEISFADTGIGLSDEILPKLFLPLFTTKAQGMGFGLAICKSIIEAQRGAISVNTVKDQGTTFILTLPVDLKKENGGENIWISNPESSL
jgi:signal transduction histidine kinase